MSCPLNRNRWAGSGYRKEPESAEATALQKRIAEMEAERAKQDACLFPVLECKPPGPAPTTQGICKKK